MSLLYIRVEDKGMFLVYQGENQKVTAVSKKPEDISLNTSSGYVDFIYSDVSREELGKLEEELNHLGLQVLIRNQHAYRSGTLQMKLEGYTYVKLEGAMK